MGKGKGNTVREVRLEINLTIPEGMRDSTIEVLVQAAITTYARATVRVDSVKVVTPKG
jgi:hypothetical protein